MYAEIVRPSDESRKTYLWVEGPTTAFFYIGRALTREELDYLEVTGGFSGVEEIDANEC